MAATWRMRRGSRADGRWNEPTSRRTILRKFRRSHILLRKRMAEVPSQLALLENHSQRLERDVASNRGRCKMLLLLGFRSSDRGFCFALRSRRLQVQILSRILAQHLFIAPDPRGRLGGAGGIPDDGALDVRIIKHFHSNELEIHESGDGGPGPG